MYCNRCGATIEPGSDVCRSCGQVQPATVVGQESKLAGHLRLLAIFWFVIAALTGVGAAVVLAIGAAAGTAMRMSMDAPPAARMLGPVVLWCAGLFVAAMAGVSFLAGYGLLKRKPWARLLAIILAFLSLMSFPFGTALGVYTLVVLLPTNAGREYERMAAAAT